MERLQAYKFQLPQGFKLDEGNSRIFLPKIGWVRYRKSRNTQGTLKQVTVSQHAGKWYASVQTAREVEPSVHPPESVVGIDMGIGCFAAFSDGLALAPLNSFRRHEVKLALAQRIVVVMEDLRVKNMRASASGSLERPGRNIRAKSGLNKSILDQGWYEFRRQIGYKLDWAGGMLILVPPQYTSQTCHACGNVAKANRVSQACFICTACSYAGNADHNAALNILAAGHAVSACGAGKAQAPVAKQEPAYGASARTLQIGIPRL